MSDAPSTGRVSASRSDELDIDGSARDSLARTIADNATAALFMMDTRGRCTYMNAAAEAMIGYRLEEIRDLPLHDAIHHHHPDGRPYPLAECPIDRALPEKNQVRRHEDVFIRKDGAYFPVLCAAEPIIRDGVPVGTVIEVRDVTEEKRAEAERKQAEESLKLQARVLESMSEGVSLTDEHGFILYTNPAEDAMFGYEPGELVGQHVTVQNTYPPEENTRIVAAVIQDLKARGSWEGEFHNRKKDGSPFITRARITSLEIGGKQHWVCVQEDITERKRADAALRESDERFRATFSQAAVGMCHLGLDGRWLWMNQKLCDIVGYTHQELRERTFTEITSPEDQAVSAEWFQRLLRGTVETYSLEMRYVRKDGSPVWVQVTVSSAREPSGAPHFFIGVVEDITRRKESEQRLREETRIVETVNRIGQTLAAELDLHKLLQSVTDAATEITGAQFGSFFYNALREDGEAYLLYTLSGAPMEAFSGFPIPRNTAIFEPTFRGEGVERLDDVTRDPRFAKNPPYHGMPEGHLPVRSYLAVPVTSRTGEGIGGLFFGH
ncbi:MAG TPA: PAS domain S-box protein, partial [Armatimonadota bacterium]|nr:PAS domain S-box protein [Armatimonadota bacterium]